MRRVPKELRGIDWRAFAILITLGTIGGFLAKAIGLPIPFLVGSLVAAGTLSIVLVATGRQMLPFPHRLRMRFVSFIGVMIGATFSPDMLDVLPQLWPSIASMGFFVLSASAVGYFILRHVGRYDQVTAFYGALPGGLIESTMLGEAAGGDVRILSVQQFVRVVFVVVSVPIIFLFYEGHSVGSSAGQALSKDPALIVDIVLIVAIGFIGSTVAPYLRIPAGHMMGPLLLSVILHSTGIVDIHSPIWLLNASQLMIGTGLGSMFGGATLRQLAHAVWLGFLAVAAMLILALGFSALLSPITPVSTEALFISFAPGGVSEMGLIALSLGVSPVIVATHHLVRILITVVFAGWVSRHVRLDPGPRKSTGT